jgi:hypothetical protein
MRSPLPRASWSPSSPSVAPGWSPPTTCHNNEDQQILRILVKISQTRELADALADDVHDSIADLRKRAAGEKVRRPVHTGHGY